MFIRRTQTRSTPSGQTYFTHRLVRSHRVSGKVRQQTLLNLGRHFSIPRHDWPLLCRRLDEILSGQLPLIQEGSAPLEEEAQRMAQRLLEGEADVTGTAGEASSEDLQTVAVDSVELTRPRSVGVEQVGRWALEQLGLVELLGELGLNGPLRAAALGAIVGRLARPGSERATWGWLGRRSGLGELLDFDFQTLSLMQMYRASDALMRHRQAIEAHLFTQAMGHDLEPTVTLFDLTNTFFEGAARRQPKAQRGHSKEKRSDCPLLTLGLVLDGAGFVRRSQVFAGRVDEPRTLAGMLGALEAPRGALVVMDRGVATEDRIQWLREEGYRYVVASRQGHRQFDPELALTLETASKARLQLHKEVSEDGGEVRLYCRSEERAHKERGIVERFSRRFEQGLARISEGLSRPRAHKGIEKVRERIGRLKEQSRGVAQHYTIEVLTNESGRKATALSWKRQPRQGSMVTHPGVYCLRSNQTQPVAHLHHSDRRGSGVSLPEVRAGPAPHLSSQAGAVGRPPVPDRHRLSTGAGHPQTPQAAGRLPVGPRCGASWKAAAGHERADLARTQGHDTDQKAIYTPWASIPLPEGSARWRFQRVCSATCAFLPL